MYYASKNSPREDGYRHFELKRDGPKQFVHRPLQLTLPSLRKSIYDTSIRQTKVESSCTLHNLKLYSKDERRQS